MDVSGLVDVTVADVQVDYAEIGAVVPYPSLLTLPVVGLLKRDDFEAFTTAVTEVIALSLELDVSEFKVELVVVEEIKVDGYEQSM